MENPLPFRRSSSEPQFLGKRTPPGSKTLTLKTPSSPSSSRSAPLDGDSLRSLHNRHRFMPAAIPVLYSVDSSSSRSRSSSVLDKIHEWAPSCFSPKNRGKNSGAGADDLSMMVEEIQEKTLRESIIRVPAQMTSNVQNTAIMVPPVSARREYVWAYKHRPKLLNEFICNRNEAEQLVDMVIKRQCSHYIFEGHPGAGKRSMVLAFLRGIFGHEKLKTRYELRRIELKEEHTSINLNVKVSSQHIEVNLSELHGYEKHVIVALMNESLAPSDKSVDCDYSDCRAIVLHEADKLSTDSQNYLRWIMEKYKGCNKIFFCCYDASKLRIIKHLCTIMKLQPPSSCEVVKVLEHIAKKEHIELSHNVAERIAKNSKNNLRQAIRSFEASWKSNPSFKDDQVILTGWEEDIANIAKRIVNEQSPKLLYAIRGKLKKLIEHNVSPDFIFSSLISELKKLVNDEYQTKIDALYKEYKINDNDHLLDPEMSVASLPDTQAGCSDTFYDSREKIHHYMRIEEFTAKFMSSYKSVITKGSAGASKCGG